MVIFSESIICKNTSNSIGIKTYDACGFIIFPSFSEFLVNNKCGRMFHLCKSLLIFIIFLIPEMVFKKFFPKVIWQCTTSNVYLLSSFCKEKHFINLAKCHSSAPWWLAEHVRMTNSAVALQSLLSYKVVINTWSVIQKFFSITVQLYYSFIVVIFQHYY